MKVAVTTRGPSPRYEVDEAFGRAYWFLIFDDAAGKWSVLDNSANRNAIENAGVNAVRLLIQHGVQVVLTGETGPKAFRALKEAGIEVFHQSFGSAEESYHAWQSARLKQSTSANSSGSPSCLVGRSMLQAPMPAVRVSAPKGYR